MEMYNKVRQGIKNRLDAAKTIEEIGKLCKHIEDISEAQDEMTKALISIFNNQIVIAKKIGVKLPDPLVKMEVEK